MKNKSIYYAGFSGGKKQVASFGAFLLIIFGVPVAITLLAKTSASSPWLFWLFMGGAIIGIIVLLSGLFAVDTQNKRL